MKFTTIGDLVKALERGFLIHNGQLPVGTRLFQMDFYESSPIYNQLYFASAKHKKMLLDLGIYERDIDKVIRIIGEDFDDASELKRRLTNNIERLTSISFISKYIIRSLQ